jgi:Trp operon repressor
VKILYYLYSWNNLVADSPQPQTRNDWLYRYGAFCRFNGLWFPCKITGYTTIGEPAQVVPVPIATINQSLYPHTMVNVQDLEVLYSVFNNGMSIEVYINEAQNRKRLTNTMLNGALTRSLNTELVTAPTRLIQQIKKAINKVWKGETHVINTNNKDDINVIELPHTADLLEKLWNSNDWAMQEISQLLGISYNPSQGKKERMLVNEMLGDRDLTIMNREKITSRLINSAVLFGEIVSHISTHIDTIDRGLSYGSGELNLQKGAL